MKEIVSHRVFEIHFCENKFYQFAKIFIHYFKNIFNDNKHVLMTYDLISIWNINLIMVVISFRSFHFKWHCCSYIYDIQCREIFVHWYFWVFSQFLASFKYFLFLNREMFLFSARLLKYLYVLFFKIENSVFDDNGNSNTTLLLEWKYYIYVI